VIPASNNCYKLALADRPRHAVVWKLKKNCVQNQILLPQPVLFVRHSKGLPALVQHWLI
jgi:hypothetical protein